jgi:hypothetical protein
MADTKKQKEQIPAPETVESTPTDPQQINAQIEQQAAEKKLDEAPASGAVYIVGGRKVDANGKPIDEKKDNE